MWNKSDDIEDFIINEIYSLGIVAITYLIV